ncbi:MAG: hypothetical protein M1817_005701 [Caeruleum heppii]|nr:MAG: hypothetical protein M1817_005701 [Caeruleum heppii]
MAVSSPALPPADSPYQHVAPATELNRVKQTAAASKISNDPQSASASSGVTTDDSATAEVGSNAASGLDGGQSLNWKSTSDPSRGEEGATSKEKKKGTSLLSRLIGTKKKDAVEDVDDDESEQGDKRTEGMDAHVFSQPLLSNGFTPYHPQPPRYIKVRSHNKKEREFNRVFLAQELNRDSEDKAGRQPSVAAIKSGSVKADAIWALKFSIDGRYLASGGHDHIVRVWAVISTTHEREAHERDEDAVSPNPNREGVRLSAPVFRGRPIKEYDGHTADVLDLSWSKNNFLLSSSMDKTVRLWHISRGECLCCFKHSDFVTSIAFHPRDDRFFLAGSLDSKLRLWSIPDKTVAFWNQLPDLITAVAFTPDGKTAMAGCLNGLCLFYETEGLKYHTQIHARSNHGRNAKGSKITGIQSINYPPEDPNGEVKLLVTSNDSRIRLYNLRDKGLEMKFKGNENTCSQIRASFSDDAKHVICGSEDRKVYVWGTGPSEGEKKDKRPVEVFAAHSAIVTTAILAPSTTRVLLGVSGDPVYDLCNPPPVVLLSKAESRTSSVPPGVNTKRDSIPSVTSSSLAAAEPSHPPSKSPGYITRSTHKSGNILVTADYMGRIKVFRQDCAYQRRRDESWETSSTFSKKLGSGLLHRSATRNSSTSRKNEAITSNPPASDRILSWRNSISRTSLDSTPKTGRSNRSMSPRKSLGATSAKSTRNQSVHSITPLSTMRNGQPSSNISPLGGRTPSNAPTSPQRQHSTPSFPQQSPQELQPTALLPAAEADPLLIQEGGQSMAFWNMQNWAGQKPSSQNNPVYCDDGDDPTHLGANHLDREPSRVSRLSSEESSEVEEVPRSSATTNGNGVGANGTGKQGCRQCGGLSFHVLKGKPGHSAGPSRVCNRCGTIS